MYRPHASVAAVDGITWDRYALRLEDRPELLTVDHLDAHARSR